MMWVCSNSACHEVSGQVGVSIWVWVCVNAVYSSGDKVRKACCHIARTWLSVTVFGWGGVREEVMGVVFLTEVKCGTRVGVDRPLVGRIVR